jgi:hypothetical protein
MERAPERGGASMRIKMFSAVRFLAAMATAVVVGGGSVALMFGPGRADAQVRAKPKAKAKAGDDRLKRSEALSREFRRTGKRPPAIPVPRSQFGCVAKVNGVTAGPYVNGAGITVGIEDTVNWNCSAGDGDHCNICVVYVVYQDGSPWPGGNGANVFCQDIDADCGSIGISSHGNSSLGQGGAALPDGIYDFDVYVYRGTCMDPGGDPLYATSGSFWVVGQ